MYCAKGYSSLVREMINRGLILQTSDRKGMLPLHCAAENGSFDVVKMMIDISTDAEIESVDKSGWTCLHFCAQGAWPQYETNLGAMRLLLAKLVNPTEFVNRKDLSGGTPLHLTDDGEAAKLLIAHGASIDVPNEEGQTPLHVSRNHQVANVLLDHKANVDSRDKYQRTPLMLAADPDKALLLLAKGCDKLARDNTRRSALDWAKVNKRVEVEAVLISNQCKTGGQITQQIEYAEFHDMCRGLCSLIIIIIVYMLFSSQLIPIDHADGNASSQAVQKLQRESGGVVHQGRPQRQQQGRPLYMPVPGNQQRGGQNA